MSSLFASIKAALRGPESPSGNLAGDEPSGADAAGLATSAQARSDRPPGKHHGHAAANSPAAQRRHSPSSVEALELELLLEALFQCHGYDFHGYERQVVERKVQSLRKQLELPTISALQSRVLHHAETYDLLMRTLYVEPALMFDHASEVSMLRLALAGLHGAPLPRVWLADCAGAQQAWSLAILLEQEQLGARTEIYATVASDALLEEAQQATLPMARLTELQGNYVRSGGVGRLLDYFEVGADGTRAVLLPQLRSRITWAQYNLVTDASFNEFQMILGQRALPDFGPALRRRVLQLFDDSLAPFGILALDQPLEDRDPLAQHYKPLLPHQPWYKRMA